MLPLYISALLCYIPASRHCTVIKQGGPCVYRAGPLCTVLVGVVLQTGGNLGLWLAAKGMFHPPYYVMLLLAAVACNGQTW